MSKVTVSFQIDEEVSAVLAEAAKESGQDVSQLLRALAEDFARQQEPVDLPEWMIQEIEEGIREADRASEDDWIPHDQALAQVQASLEAHIAAKARK